MPRIDFPVGSEGTEDLPRTRRDLHNCFNNGVGRIIARPGISTIKTGTGGVARGNFEWNGSLYQVQSENLEKITNLITGESTTIGTVAGSGNVETAIGFNTAVIVDPGGNLYTLDKSDVLVDISGNANFVPCRDVAHMNGRFIYIPFDGDPAFFSDVGAAGTVQALSFFDAEELPDKNNSVFNGKNTLHIGGDNSWEKFRDTGASPVPYTRITGSRILNGYIGGLLEYNNTFLFIGREKDQDRGIYSIVQGGAAKISNERIDLLLSTYSDGELALAVSGRIKWRGYDLATFALGRDSFGYLGGHWFFLDTIINDVSLPWTAGFIAQFEGTYYTAHSDNIGKFADVNTDYGDRSTHIIDMAIEQEEADNFTIQSVELGVSQGFNASVGSIAVLMSRDNVTYPGQALYRNLGAIGQYDQKLVWNPPGGMGGYRGFAGLRIYTTEDIKFSFDFVNLVFA